MADNIFEALGVRTIINAAATETRLGGSIMNPKVSRAMHEASQHFVNLQDLHRVVGEKIAVLTRNEGATVTTGVAAGIYLACAGLLKLRNPEAFALLPNTLPHGERVVVHIAHNVPFMCSVEQFGLKLEVVGKLGPRVDDRAIEIEQELQASKKPLAVIYVAAGLWIPEGAPSFEAYVDVCNRHGVPLIVDAAAQLPPVENLWQFTQKGATAVLFSGGKDLKGPSSAGLLLGRKNLTDTCREILSPNHGVGRIFKVDKEELVGTLVAVQEYLAMDHRARTEWCEEQIRRVTAALAGRTGLRVTRSFPNEAGQNVPRARIEYDPARQKQSQKELLEAFENGAPAVAFLPGELGETGALYLNPMTLQEGETEMVIKRLLEVLR